MRKLTKVAIGFAATVMGATAAWAWGYDVSQAREIYRDVITVKTNNGKLGHATIVYAVTAVAFVGEDGNAHWPDNRACYYNDIRRTLVRTLNYTAPDGTIIPLRDTTVVLPNLPGHHWGAVTTCNDVIGQINNTLVQSTGTAADWQPQISADTAEADKILAQFGNVITHAREMDVRRM